MALHHRSCSPPSRLCPSPDCLLQEELGSSLSGSEELAQAEEQVAAVQQLFT